jgi:hypothetical protein
MDWNVLYLGGFDMVVEVVTERLDMRYGVGSFLR